MPPKRKASASKSTASTTPDPNTNDDDTRFDKIFKINGFVVSDSEDSDWATGKNRKKLKKAAKKHTRTTEAPEMSDQDWMTEEDVDIGGAISGSERAGPNRELTASTFKANDNISVRSGIVTINAPGNTVINLNIADLLEFTRGQPKKLGQNDSVATFQSQETDTDDTTLVHWTPPKQTASSRRTALQAKLIEARKSRESGKTGDKASAKKVGFLSLPAELRSRIYNDVFVEQKHDLHGRQDTICFITDSKSFSGQFLRTCRQVLEEGRPFLYSNNHFEFRRNSYSRGNFWHKQWKEIGYKDVRRFFEVIGPVNTSFIKRISFWLSDALPSATPGLTCVERKFVHDAGLHRVFELISRTAVLNELRVKIDARSFITGSDYHFLRYITKVKCLSFECEPLTQWHPPKIRSDMMKKMRKVMIVKEEEAGGKSE